jgi:hypothetical protein
LGETLFSLTGELRLRMGPVADFIRRLRQESRTNGVAPPRLEDRPGTPERVSGLGPNAVENGKDSTKPLQSVKVQDIDRFVATSRRFEPMMAEMGARNQATYQDQNDPTMVWTISEWDSHDAMHEPRRSTGTSSTPRPRPRVSVGDSDLGEALGQLCDVCRVGAHRLGGGDLEGWATLAIARKGLDQAGGTAPGPRRIAVVVVLLFRGFWHATDPEAALVCGASGLVVASAAFRTGRGWAPPHRVREWPERDQRRCGLHVELDHGQRDEPGDGHGAERGHDEPGNA